MEKGRAERRSRTPRAQYSSSARRRLSPAHPRTLARSVDGGATFGAAFQSSALAEPAGGCEASSITTGGCVLPSRPVINESNRHRLLIKARGDLSSTAPTLNQAVIGY